MAEKGVTSTLQKSLFWRGLLRKAVRNTKRADSALTLYWTYILRYLTEDFYKEFGPGKALEEINFSERILVYCSEGSHGNIKTAENISYAGPFTLACWDCGFEFHRGIDVCLFCVCCQVDVSVTS
jgi:hypothetical protein